MKMVGMCEMRTEQEECKMARMCGIKNGRRRIRKEGIQKKYRKDAIQQE